MLTYSKKHCMRHIYNNVKVFTVCVLAALLLPSCGNSDRKVLDIVAERDSLRTENESQRQRLTAINEMVGTINATLDSISIAEGMLFGDNHTEAVPSRSSVLKNLERYEQVVLRQHQRINELEALAAKSKTDKAMQGLIDHMKSQLAEKDGQIARLRAELSNKNVNISRLRRQVESQHSQLAKQGEELDKLGKKTELQATALARQDKELNNGYVMIDTKAELKRKGIARRKKVINEGLLDKSKFTQVDIRNTTILTFNAKKPRILTNMPQSSYTMTKNGDGTYTLNITDPTRFWSISRYLVIQTN